MREGHGREGLAGAAAAAAAVGVAAPLSQSHQKDVHGQGLETRDATYGGQPSATSSTVSSSRSLKLYATGKESRIYVCSRVCEKLTPCRVLQALQRKATTLTLLLQLLQRQRSPLLHLRRYRVPLSLAPPAQSRKTPDTQIPVDLQVAARYRTVTFLAAILRLLLMNRRPSSSIGMKSSQSQVLMAR